MRNFTLFVSVRLWLVFLSLRSHMATALAVLLPTLTLPAQAADDLFGIVDNVAEGAEMSNKSLLKLAKFGGIALVIFAITLWVSKKKNPQITWGWILTPLGAGCLMIAIDQVIKKTQTTIKINPVDVG